MLSKTFSWKFQNRRYTLLWRKASLVHASLLTFHDKVIGSLIIHTFWKRQDDIRNRVLVRLTSPSRRHHKGRRTNYRRPLMWKIDDFRYHWRKPVAFPSRFHKAAKYLLLSDDETVLCVLTPKINKSREKNSHNHSNIYWIYLQFHHTLISELYYVT